MLEFILCSLVTILPDYLIRRFIQGKRWGREITLFSMWYELRWGVTGAMLLTVALITLIFYYHPTTTNAVPLFRTVTILPEGGGRVEEVFVSNGQQVEAGEPLFSLYDNTQLAAVELARSRLIEVDAAYEVAKSDLAAASGLVDQARALLLQMQNELRMKRALRSRDPGIVSDQEIRRLEHNVASNEGSVAAVLAQKESAGARLATVLPSQRASAQEALEQAEVEQQKTIVSAGIDGLVQQFILQPGDYVNPILRPAGLLIPIESGHKAIQAGFPQLVAGVVKPGTLAEVTCLSKPFTVIPMVVTYVQGVIAAGQLRPTDQLVDIQDRARPGTLVVSMEPLYEDGLEGVVPGTKCIANAYTNNHALIATGELGTGRKIWLHMIDTVGIVHAAILRVQTLMLPVKMLVFSGH